LEEPSASGSVNAGVAPTCILFKNFMCSIYTANIQKKRGMRKHPPSKY